MVDFHEHVFVFQVGEEDTNVFEILDYHFFIILLGLFDQMTVTELGHQKCKWFITYFLVQHCFYCLFETDLNVTVVLEMFIHHAIVLFVKPDSS